MLGLVLVVQALGSGVVRADAPAARPPAVVFLASRDRAATLQRTLLALRAHLAGDPVRLDVDWVDAWPADLARQLRRAREVAAATGATAVCWTPVGLPARIYLLVPRPEPGQVYRRDVGDAGDGGEAGRAEAEAIILRESIRALLRGEEVGQVVPVVPDRLASGPPPRRATIVRIAPPPPPVRPRPRVPARPWVTLEAAYQVAGYASEAPASHGLWLDLAVHPHPRWSVFVAFLVLPPVRRSGTLADLTVQRFPVTLGGRFRWLRGRIDASVSAAVTLDPLQYRTQALEEELTVLGDGRDHVVSVDLLAMVHVRLIGRLRAFAATGVQVPLNSRRYLAESEDQRETLLSPWPVRPQALLGLALDLY